MINITNLKFNFFQITNADTAIAINVQPRMKYVKGTVTNDIEGYTYELVLPANRYEKIKVKVIEDKPIITLDELITKGGMVKVKPKNFEGKFYKTSSGEYSFTSTASAMEIIS